MVNCMICGGYIEYHNFIFFCRRCYQKHAIKKRWITKYDFIKYINASFNMKVDRSLGSRTIYLLLKIKYPNILPLNQIYEKVLFIKLFNPIYFT